MQILRSPNLQDGDDPIVVRVFEPRVARFAQGGLARAAEAVRGRGRYGDDVLIHITPEEFGQLQAAWGEPTYNPHTGLPEYGFLSKLKKAVKNIGKSIEKTAMPWTINKQDIEDIKHGKGLAATGTPLHGLTAGLKVHELMSPTVHVADRIQDLRKNGFSKDHLKWAIEDQNHNLQDAVKENIVPLAMFIGAGAGGALGGGGGGAGGAGAGAVEGVSSAGGALPGAAGALPAGIEGVTVTASQLPSWAGAVDAATALGAGASAVDAANVPNEDMGMETPDSQDPSFLDRAWDYASNSDNWQQLAAGVGALGSLAGGGGGGGNGGPPAQDPGYHLDTPLYSGRSLNQNIDDYYTYGAGPEHNFYEDVPVVGAAQGGGMNFGYGNGGGALSRLVRGPGTGRSDEIPARLSDGEYVFDAETVALLGDGSTDEGARRLDELRRKLRMHKGKQLSKGKFSSNAKKPEEYL